MSRRYYHPNQTITVKKYRLSITTNGVVYHDSYEGFRKLESLWQSKIGTLSVVLPDDTTVRLKPTKEGIRLIEDKLTIDN